LVVTAPDGSSVTNAVALYLEYSEVQPSHLLETRTALELKCVELATERIDEAGVQRLQAIVAREAAIEPAAFADHSHDIHVALAEITGDPVMALFVRVLTRLTGEHAYRLDERPETGSTQAHHVHTKIVEAVIAGDSALARRRMLRHLEAIGPWLR
jgi:DNA-binding FadR family transcriptional regulator